MAPGRALTSLHHYIDEHWLAEAYRRTRKDGATGTDGVTAEEYERDLMGNLRSLLERFKSGQYRAPAVRRAWVPKRTGRELRPIGIPTFEDKVLQRAVAMVLEAVYEEDFLDCSYGFRPGRSAHQGLQAVRDSLMEMGGGWVLEVDIRSFFEELDATHLRAFLDLRVRDGVLRRMIDKWLKAGVLEGEQVLPRERGTPQGGVISPLLANLYLHEVVDRWYVEEVRPRMRGASFLVRYADDLVMGFAQESDAQRVKEVLQRRCERYGLRLHPEKTRVVAMRRPAFRGTPTREQRPGSFDFLGFTHVWVRSRKGYWVIRQQTAKDRLRRAIQRCGEWCRRHRHEPVAWQHRQLSRAYLGHLSYYGITGNLMSLNRLRRRIERVWHQWLARRSQRGLPWKRFQELHRRFALPRPVIVHQYYRA